MPIKKVPAEARLTEHLVAGGSLIDYADQARVSIHTVRWTSKQVFAKTDTRGQADLVRLILKSALPIAGGDDARPA